jgi:uncharacterized membrane protein YhhN
MINPDMAIRLGIAALYAVLLAVYLNAEKKNDGKTGFRKAMAIKLTLSGIFCATGILCYWEYVSVGVFGVGYVPPQLFILLGLFAAFAGDYFLQYIKLNEKKYIAGICCFAAAQVLFITALILHSNSYILNSDNSYLMDWILSVIITVVVLLCVLAMMKKQRWRLGGEKNVITVYTVLLTFMTAKAVSSLTVQTSPGWTLFAAGAVLFLISDMLLGIWNYHTGKRVHANLNWISYYAGMLLIAFSTSDIYIHFI